MFHFWQGAESFPFHGVMRPNHYRTSNLTVSGIGIAFGCVYNGWYVHDYPRWIDSLFSPPAFAFSVFAVDLQTFHSPIVSSTFLPFIASSHIHTKTK